MLVFLFQQTSRSPSILLSIHPPIHPSIHPPAPPTHTAGTRRNTEEFLVYRFLEPGRAILEDLILNRRVRLTDPAAIADAQSSLQRVSEGGVGVGGGGGQGTREELFVFIYIFEDVWIGGEGSSWC